MSEKTSKEAALPRQAGFVQTDGTNSAAEEVQADQLSQSSAEDWLHTAQAADDVSQRDQKYVRPYISVDRSSVQDVVSGTMYKTVNIYSASTKQAQVVTDQESDNEMRRVRATYVKPRPYERARKILDERGVLVLWGETAHGKATTALHLLLERYGTVLRLDPTTDLEQLRAHEFNQSQGYIIDTLAPESAQKLKSFILSVLSGKLHKRQSSLVITVDSQVSLERVELIDYLLQWRERPPYAQVLERHLTWLMPQNDALAREEVRRLMEEEEVQQFIRSTPLLRDVCELAALLKQVIDGDLAFDQAIQQVSFFALNQVHDWFGKPARAIRERSLMITLAVFNGATYQIVNEAEEQLRRIIEPPRDETQQSPVEQLFFESTRDRLRAVCASQKKTFEETNVGKTEVTVIQFDNPSFQRVVLEHIWQEYDRLQAPLIEWLRELGCHTDEDIRGRAAAAVGWLSRFEINTVINEIVLPWASDERWQPRASAALALGVLTYDDRFAPIVIELLRNWCRVKSLRALKLTAISAYGGLVGERFPNIALQRLCLLTQVSRADTAVLNGVMSSVVALFLSRQQDVEHGRKVLESLVLWTESPGYALAIWTGLVIFLRLAEGARIEAKPGEGTWPTLLWLLKEDEEALSRIATLWKRALTNRLTSRQALRGTLRRWVRIVDNDKRLYPAFEKLMIDLAKTGDENDYERIENFLENRIEDPKDQSSAARKILATIRQ